MISLTPLDSRYVKVEVGQIGHLLLAEGLRRDGHYELLTSTRTEPNVALAYFRLVKKLQSRGVVK